MKPDKQAPSTDKPKQPVFARQLRWLLYLSLAELYFASKLPPNPLTDYPYLVALVDFAQSIAPVIGKINASITVRPETVKLFMSVTLLILPIKMIWLYQWLRTNPHGVYSALVISPLTDSKLAKGVEWLEIDEGLDDKRPRKPRSMASRVFWSVMILGLSFGSLLFLSDGPVDYTAPPNGNGIHLLGKGVLSMWYQWIIRSLGLSTLLIPVALCIIQDYITYFKLRFSSNIGDQHE